MRAALALVPLSRLADGLDGAVARARRPTDFGGLLDIVCDFVFYGAVPLAFAWRDPAATACAAAFLLFTFYVNGASFLAYAALAAKRGLETTTRGVKSIYFTAGLVEGIGNHRRLRRDASLAGLVRGDRRPFGLLTLATAAGRMAVGAGGSSQKTCEQVRAIEVAAALTGA